MPDTPVAKRRRSCSRKRNGGNHGSFKMFQEMELLGKSADLYWSPNVAAPSERSAYDRKMRSLNAIRCSMYLPYLIVSFKVSRFTTLAAAPTEILPGGKS